MIWRTQLTDNDHDHDDDLFWEEGTTQPADTLSGYLLLRLLLASLSLSVSWALRIEQWVCTYLFASSLIMSCGNVVSSPSCFFSKEHCVVVVVAVVVADCGANGANGVHSRTQTMCPGNWIISEAFLNCVLLCFCEYLFYHYFFVVLAAARCASNTRTCACFFRWYFSFLILTYFAWR